MQAVYNKGGGIGLGNDAIVRECIASRNDGLGINVAEGSTVNGNITSFNGAGGIQASSAIVTHNTALDNGYLTPGQGFGIQSTNSTITGNIVRNSSYGITAAGSTISNNTVTGNQVIGIRTGCASSVWGNTVSDNGTNVNTVCVTDKDHNATLP